MIASASRRRRHLRASAAMPSSTAAEQLGAARGRSAARSHSRAASVGGGPRRSSGPRTTIVPGTGGRAGEVGRAQPRVGAQLAHAGVGHRRAEVAASGEVAARRDDGDDPPRAVPGIAGRAPADVLGRLALEQPAAQLVARRRRPPARRRRASARSPCASCRGRCRTARRGATAPSAAQARRRQAEQHGQHERPGVERADARRRPRRPTLAVTQLDRGDHRVV